MRASIFSTLSADHTKVKNGWWKCSIIFYVTLFIWLVNPALYSISPNWYLHLPLLWAQSTASTATKWHLKIKCHYCMQQLCCEQGGWMCLWEQWGCGSVAFRDSFLDTSVVLSQQFIIVLSAIHFVFQGSACTAVFYNILVYLFIFKCPIYRLQTLMAHGQSVHWVKPPVPVTCYWSSLAPLLTTRGTDLTSALSGWKENAVGERSALTGELLLLLDSCLGNLLTAVLTVGCNTVP